MNRVRVLRGKALLGLHMEPATVVIDDGHIAAIHRGHVSTDTFAEDVRVDDAHYISPGLIDLQVNGGNGAEIGDSSDAVDHVSAWLPETGVTAWLPTVVTALSDFYAGVFDAWSRVDAEKGAVPLGYHLEGPFISPEKKGAHQLRYIESASEALIERWTAQDCVRIVTLAPERHGALDHIRQLVEAGVVVSLGHTNATYEEYVAGIDAGATKATHLFNTMTSIHHRTPGAMVAALTDDRVTAGVIPDGIHTHPAMVRLAIDAKGVDRMLIVTDMMAAAGLEPGTYGLGGQEVSVDETTARLDDGTLAGSVITMDAAIRNILGWSHASLAETLYMATAVPARVIGERDRGLLHAGALADIIVWDRDLNVQETIIGGQSIYRRGTN
ncbi:MAG TPA: N-acetylglucosamine-6-phosphate deacetylase [Thermomicrobiales bacterium]|nr:N-acetylglucosamine-6-phosphate deacetylase [Thermomicrobiales bacterium]